MHWNHCRYLPVTRQEGFDLRAHIETAGHQVTWNEIWPRLNLIQMCNSPIPQIELCKHIVINSCSCRGYLSKQGTRLKGWNRWWWWWEIVNKLKPLSRRWFVFDRNKRTLVYYADKSEVKIPPDQPDRIYQRNSYQWTLSIILTPILLGQRHGC